MLTSTARHRREGWNAPPAGDVEMQLVKQPTAANETLLGGEPTEARPTSEAPKAPEAEAAGIARPALPPHTPSIR